MASPTKRKSIKRTTKRTIVKRKVAKKVAPKLLSKKVGKWRCICKARTVTCAGAKHSYKTPAAACAAYKRITSVKAVESFVTRYGKKATKKAVVKTKRRNPEETKTAVAAPAATNPRRRKGTKRNAPLSKTDRSALKHILKRHGYRV